MTDRERSGAALLSTADIRQDPGIKKLLSRMPAEVGASFSEQQLAHLRIALGARQWGKHQLDIRGTLRIFHWRYYYVLVAGRNSRDGQRSQQQLSRLMLALVISVLLVISTMFGLLVLYLVKSALGIDIFEGFSLGIWSWFKALFH
ncbi:MAG: 3-phosphoshikimate 1-carboxyvinyltransferase [Gammaproteobacteria bacterium]|jgi:hypothetical protein|nr:3-phosphoshikimate 1-carboxyvinyltransferase [Gammaproteobacteria bacterium]MBU2180900.1 3-phosphoshikimate 1-carboxyvinyltransferase [Gammaproteobacteria bacterium]MBU2226038.1 3-phosphoshikimate 1-carboxyvinyltransferase [Gammaproteobacteria bacterium]MBU2278125.1 3-phosphoshikimate 1-carboxyvinyltransferase [Gammaproteobacteria bacterium]MBU2429003.1 3-phosphoshikimate 1-carboxyvinyltransferase [Gammaproteobacteria bacterium]